MNKKLAVLSLFASLAVTANACDTGAHTKLECETGSYTSECLADASYMVCKDNKLVVESCGDNAYCKASETNGIECVQLEVKECDSQNPCTDANKVCNDEGKCVDKPVEAECTVENAAEKCPAGKPVCVNGVCTAKEPECTVENAAQNCPAIRPVCVEGVCTAVEPECTEENAAEKCTDPEKPVCTNGICSAVATEPECTEENAADKCTDPEKPVCIEGVCSADNSEPECTDENVVDKCTDPEKPLCIEGVCSAVVPECTEETAATACPANKPLCKDGVCTPECNITTAEEDCKDPEKPICSGGICVAKPKDKECVTNDECKDETKPVCNSYGTCVAKPEVQDKCGALPGCTGDTYCLNGECLPKTDIDGKECTDITFTSCSNNARVSCESMFESTYYSVDDCGANKVCALDNDGFAFCAIPCTAEDAAAGKTITTCDPNSTYDVSEGTYSGEITYKCTQSGDNYYMTVFASKICTGTENCMIITGTNDRCSY